jgi:glycosyltransferase involved in cell wall biosynthesis
MQDVARTNSVCKVVMVGAFPLPMHGMAAVNEAVRNRVCELGVRPVVIDLAAADLDRSLGARLGRLPRVLVGLVRLASLGGVRRGAHYMSVSGGWGQLYELAFVALARLRQNRVFLHHHSYAYLNRRSVLTAALLRLAGSKALHIALSPRMAACLKRLYRVERVVAVSNAVFLADEVLSFSSPARRQLGTLGFLSNIAPEKGVFEFLDLAAAVLEEGLPVQAKLAGGFQDADTERRVLERLSSLPNVEYVGPQYGEEKEEFFSSIDVLVLPTRYVNEAEPLVVHEAMARGVAVIAYDRGAISEIVCGECGKVIDQSSVFVPEALAVIKRWASDPGAIERVSLASKRRFADLHTENARRWQGVLGELLQGGDGSRMNGEDRSGTSLP